MKFVVPITRIESRDVEVFAPDRDAALQAALLTNPGFKAEWVVELDEEGEEKTTHGFFNKCESCEKNIWEGEKYAISLDCGIVCEACYIKTRE